MMAYGYRADAGFHRDETTCRTTGRFEEDLVEARQRRGGPEAGPRLAAGPRGRRRRPGAAEAPREVVVAALALLACCGAIIGLIILLSPLEPARLVLIGGSYADNLSIPHNAVRAAQLQGLHRAERAGSRPAAFLEVPADPDPAPAGQVGRARVEERVAEVAEGGRPPEESGGFREPTVDRLPRPPRRLRPRGGLPPGRRRTWPTACRSPTCSGPWRSSPARSRNS